MENNLENKAKFFATYWGCEIIYTGTGKPIKSLGKTSRMSYENADRFQSILYSNQRSLLLKSLSDVSDEDAIEVGNINGNITSNNLFVGKALVHWLNVNGTRRDITFDAVDFLRSKGYLLPWMGLSTEELINRGWAVTTNLKKMIAYARQNTLLMLWGCLILILAPGNTQIL